MRLEGRFNAEIPIDPAIYFFGDEITMGLRAYCHGYDFFHPHRVIAWRMTGRREPATGRIIAIGRVEIDGRSVAFAASCRGTSSDTIRSAVRDRLPTTSGTSACR